jgi:hypothetical protein
MVTINRDRPRLFITTVTRNSPVRAEVTAQAEACRWPSVRQWLAQVAEDEPLCMDLEKVDWRRSQEGAAFR